MSEDDLEFNGNALTVGDAFQRQSLLELFRQSFAIKSILARATKSDSRLTVDPDSRLFPS